MDCLLDTNILIDGASGRSNTAAIRTALSVLHSRGFRLCVLAQNLVEFWSVCTRPVNVNGLGLTTLESAARLSEVEALFFRLPESDEIHAVWREFIIAHQVKGRQVHDARIAAAMQVNGITDILTFNATDFARYPGIQAIHPREVAA